MKLTFSFLEGRYGIYRCAPDIFLAQPLKGFLSFTRTDNEVTVICPEGYEYAEEAEEGWVAMKLHGPFDLALTGILAEVSKILAAEKIPIFALSTFETDYILIKQDKQKAAIAAMKKAGHNYLESRQ